MRMHKGHIKQVGKCVFSSVDVENQDGGDCSQKNVGRLKLVFQNVIVLNLSLKDALSCFRRCLLILDKDDTNESLPFPCMFLIVFQQCL